MRCTRCKEENFILVPAVQFDNAPMCLRCWNELDEIDALLDWQERESDE
jgi:hypothetical protein